MNRHPAVVISTNLLTGSAWNFVTLQAILAILLGLFFLFNVKAALIVLAILLGVLLIGCGFQQLTLLHRSCRWGHWLYGAVLLIAGIFLVAHPLISGLQLLLVLGIWLIFHAFELLISAWLAGGVPKNVRILAVLNGIFSLLFGILILREPIAGVAVVNFIFTFYLLLYGLVTLVIGLRLRRLGRG